MTSRYEVAFDGDIYDSCAGRGGLRGPPSELIMAHAAQNQTDGLETAPD